VVHGFNPSQKTQERESSRKTKRLREENNISATKTVNMKTGRVEMQTG
jgi:hypothetical protein